jgi:cytochrome P450
MWTPVLPDQLAALPVEELSTSAAPSRWHGPLRSLGTHCRDGAWVVSGSRDVAVALAAPALSVAPPAGPAGPAASLLSRMARFSDGDDHRLRRDLVIRLLPPVAKVARAAGARANDYLRRRAAAFDIMPMARLLPAEVLARALGLAPDAADRAAVLTGTLCDALTPSLVPRTGTGTAGDDAAQELAALVASSGYRDTAEQVAVISILFQARDSTAALIGSAVLARPANAALSASPALARRGLRRGAFVAPTPGDRVEYVLRSDAPAQCTRRTATSDVQIGDAIIPGGAAVWIFVGTAERGSGMPATFGTGPHGCPGAAHATAIARQVVTVLHADGWRPLAGQRIDLEPRPNLRVPARVMVSRP